MQVPTSYNLRRK